MKKKLHIHTYMHVYDQMCTYVILFASNLVSYISIVC